MAINPVIKSPVSFGKGIDLAIVFLAILLVPILGVILTEAVYPSVEQFDPDETFLWISIHHLIQLVLTIALCIGVGQKQKANPLHMWGFNLNKFKESCIWIAVFAVVWFAIEYFRISRLTTINIPFPLSERNMVGVQFFQYVLSGLCEEPLFRGFVIVFLATHWSRTYKVAGVEISQAVLISVALFMIAHVEINYLELSISGFDFDQQMKSLQLGLLYGICFHYTQSLLAPIVIHGLSNGIQFSLMFMLL